LGGQVAGGQMPGGRAADGQIPGGQVAGGQVLKVVCVVAWVVFGLATLIVVSKGELSSGWDASRSVLRVIAVVASDRSVEPASLGGRCCENGIGRADGHLVTLSQRAQF